jgi:hypothetical protein
MVLALSMLVAMLASTAIATAPAQASEADSFDHAVISYTVTVDLVDEEWIVSNETDTVSFGEHWDGTPIEEFVAQVATLPKADPSDGLQYNLGKVYSNASDTEPDASRVLTKCVGGEVFAALEIDDSLDFTGDSATASVDLTVVENSGGLTTSDCGTLRCSSAGANPWDNGDCRNGLSPIHTPFNPLWLFASSNRSTAVSSFSLAMPARPEPGQITAGPVQTHTLVASISGDASATATITAQVHRVRTALPIFFVPDLVDVGLIGCIVNPASCEEPPPAPESGPVECDTTWIWCGIPTDDLCLLSPSSCQVIPECIRTGTCTIDPVPTPAKFCDGHTVTVDISAGESPTSGDDVILGTAGDDEIDGLEGDDIICGLEGNDLLRGAKGADKLIGGPGNDTLRGMGGADVLDGGAGNDRLIGNHRNDLLLGGEDGDILQGGAGRDRVRGDAGNDKLNGGPGPDKLWGDAGDDLIKGQTGNDTLLGGTGSDRLIGGLGVNSLDGGSGVDTCRVDNNSAPEAC